MLIEGSISALYNRVYKTFYIKAETEVDIALILNNRFFSIEVKNSFQLSHKEIRQIIKYKKGIIGYTGKTIQINEHNIVLLPLPLLAFIAH